MNEKGLRLIEKIRQEEAVKFAQIQGDSWRLRFHLMPPVGWLNDPNGLCQADGVYHVFFQYSPFDANGGDKFWGHYTSRNLRDWNYCGAPLAPDEAYDRNGVYSGCSFVEEKKMYLFYTGNVKHPGDYDYILKGRGANVVLVESEDGIHFSEKELLLTNEDYPSDCTCHVRDPKVFAKGGRYFMVLGARLRNDSGVVLLYESLDLKSWEFQAQLQVPYSFGYMWECPDLFEVDGKWFLSLSPQGLPRNTHEFQNVYASGYFAVDGDFRAGCRLKQFIEWDKGFDFYAPQTFMDESGRTILIGWAGLPDIEQEYDNPTVERGWQHALTVPRVISNHDGRLYQYPAAELDLLRGKKVQFVSGDGPADFAAGLQAEAQPGFAAGQRAEAPAAFDLLLKLEESAGQLSVRIADGLEFSWDGKEAVLAFAGELRSEGLHTEQKFGGIGVGKRRFAGIGRGRTQRRALLPKLREVRILADTSLVEIYCNRGEVVFTTRYYPEGETRSLNINGSVLEAACWEMKTMQVKGIGK